MQLMNLTDEIAALAHRCWCMEMLADGWRLGEAIDHEARTHPALRPFEELPAFDKENLREHIVQQNMPAELARVAADEIFEPELSLRDMRVGLEMRHVDAEHIVGRVVAWKVADASTGRLASISIEWPDGNVDDYDPSEPYVFPAHWPDQ